MRTHRRSRVIGSATTTIDRSQAAESPTYMSSEQRKTADGGYEMPYRSEEDYKHGMPHRHLQGWRKAIHTYYEIKEGTMAYAGSSARVC